MRLFKYKIFIWLGTNISLKGLKVRVKDEKSFPNLQNLEEKKSKKNLK